MIINLPKDLEKETTHRYGPNSFKLHRCVHGQHPLTASGSICARSWHHQLAALGVVRAQLAARLLAAVYQAQTLHAIAAREGVSPTPKGRGGAKEGSWCQKGKVLPRSRT